MYLYVPGWVKRNFTDDGKMRVPFLIKPLFAKPLPCAVALTGNGCAVSGLSLG